MVALLVVFIGAVTGFGQPLNAVMMLWVSPPPNLTLTPNPDSDPNPDPNPNSNPDDNPNPDPVKGVECSFSPLGILYTDRHRLCFRR